mmetsp:Transcript_8391/g.22075  ORF Transcript_8391/g.22075 Transcript_8391/m.22075 type:complete len:577 (+) Transcript_8391:721-2451(+)
MSTPFSLADQISFNKKNLISGSELNHNSIHPNLRVNGSHKVKARHKPDGPRHKRRRQGHHKAIPQEDHAGQQMHLLPLLVRPQQENRAIREDVDPNARRRPVRSPPPPVILAGEREVRGADGHLRARHHEDDEHEREEAKHVEDRAVPERRHDESELDEDDEERQDRRRKHQQKQRRLGGPRNFARDLVRPHGELIRLRRVAKVRTDDVERHRNDEPQSQQNQQRRERHAPRGLLVPQNHVKHKEHGERDPGKEQCGTKRDQPLVLALQPRVQARREEPAHRPGKTPHGEQRGEEAAAVRRGEEAEEREGDGEGGNEHELDAGAVEHGEELEVVRDAEDVAVDELPAEVLLEVLVILHVVVAREVEVDGAQQDRRDDAREEHGNQQRVDDGEPLNLLRLHARRQQRVPPRGPPDRTRNELHLVLPLHLCAFLYEHLPPNPVRALAPRRHLEPDDAVQRRLRRWLVQLRLGRCELVDEDGDRQHVVDGDGGFVFALRGGRRRGAAASAELVPHGEGAVGVAGDGGHVVHVEVDEVVVFDEAGEFGGGLCVEDDGASGGELLVDLHVEGEVGRLVALA